MPSRQKQRNSPTQVLFASLVGTTVEFFDFYIYATAAVIVFPKLFFPATDATAAMFASLATFYDSTRVRIRGRGRLTAKVAVPGNFAFQLFKAQTIRLFEGADTGLHSGYTFCDFDWYQQVPTNDNMQKCIRAQFESPIQNTLPWSTWLEREVIRTP